MHSNHCGREESKKFSWRLRLQSEALAPTENIPFYGLSVTLNNKESVYEDLQADIS